MDNLINDPSREDECNRFDELVELHCLLELLDIKDEFDFWAGRPELLARQAIPLMHGVDPESWRKYLRNKKGLPGDMAQFVEDSLEFAEIDGTKKASPSDWLKWGRGRGLHEHTLKPDYVNIMSEVCLLRLFENAVIRALENNTKASEVHKTESEPKAYKNKWDNPLRWEHKARMIGREYFKENPEKGVVAIAKHVEGELSNRGVVGVRGNGFLDWETIKREALTGITGRKSNGAK